MVQGERQPAHCVLAHHVSRNQGVLDHTEERGHVDQHSVALRPELLQRCARRQGGSQHVGAHEPLDRVYRLVLHSAGNDHRRAVHPRVDPSERLVGPASDVLEVAGTRNVPRYGNGSGAESATFLDQRGQVVLVSGRQYELRVVLGERKRRCSTNAAARPDDHDHRARQFAPHSRAALTQDEPSPDRAEPAAVDAVSLAARRAVFAVLVAALRAVRPVVVAPRFAVVAVCFVDLGGGVGGPFTPAFAARAVLVPLRVAARTVRLAPVLADDLVARAVRAARSLARLALRVASMAASVPSEAPDRTCVAVLRATFDPVGDTRGFLRRSTVAMMSPIAVTPPCARPLTVSPMRSATPAAEPTTRLPGGVSGARGWG